MDTIVRDIKRCITEKGLKVRVLSGKAGMSEKSFYSVMSGKRKLKVSEFFHICEALEIAPSAFYKRFLAREEGEKDAASDVD